ncbi:uncharacterized protein LOC6498069 [Drosophila ananassae]|uniref:uncharacterized protein LOC6498069 n=1 Tax=Drosophila ananassae TaxID=7217 RepID=UPI000177DAF7|nr:uncharacterized protein LOC6498069 [Drosophila ananassae]
MPTIPDSDFHPLRPSSLQGLELFYIPLYYGVKVTSSLLSAISSFLYCLWSPPLRRSS